LQIANIKTHDGLLAAYRCSKNIPPVCRVGGGGGGGGQRSRINRSAIIVDVRRKKNVSFMPVGKVPTTTE